MYTRTGLDLTFSAQYLAQGFRRESDATGSISCGNVAGIRDYDTDVTENPSYHEYGLYAMLVS